MDKKEKEVQVRVEYDSIGEKEVPGNVYYGIQTMRAAENFYITGLTMHSELIISIAQIKKAAAITNYEVGRLDKRRVDAIVTACDEIIASKLQDQFIVDPIQGGAGTSLNMNANEVIANRAIELLGGKKGDYSLVNPNDHVKYGQSTNDVFPSCGRITAYKLLIKAQKQLERLYAALTKKAEEFDQVIKMGRTQLQDAVPIRLGIIFYNLFQSIETLTYAVSTLVDNCIIGITANEEHCRQMVEDSVGIITAICPHVGYEKAAVIAREAIRTGASVKALILSNGLLSKEKLDIILNPYTMTEPGISGKELQRN